MTSCATQTHTATLVLRSAGWNYASNLLKLTLALATTMFYARKVLPTEFGLLALAQVSIRITEVLADFGLGNAIVQRKTLSDGDIHTALLLSLITSLGLGAVLAALAPRLAEVFNEQRLTLLLRLMAASIGLAASSTVLRGLLRRQMRFRILTVLEGSAQVVSHMFVGIPLVLLGYGVWGLVWAGIVGPLLSFSGLLLICSKELGFGFNRECAIGLCAYGGRMTASSLIQVAGHVSQPLLMAKTLGTGSVGLFTTSQRLVSLPLEGITTAFRAALFPVFSTSHVRSELRIRYLKSYCMISTIILTWCGFVFSTAEVLVPLVLGERWTAAIPIVKVLSLGYAFGYMNSIVSTLIESTPNLSSKLMADAGYLILLVISILVLHRRGMLAVITAYSALEAVRWVFYGVLPLPSIGVSRLEWFGLHLTFWPIALPFAMVVLFSGNSVTGGTFGQMLRIALGSLAAVVGVVGTFFLQLGWQGFLKLTRAMWASPLKSTGLLLESLRHAALAEG